MRQRRLITLTAASSAVMLLLAGCTFPGIPLFGGSSEQTSGQVTVNALYAAGDTGGVAQQRISMAPSDDGGVRIDFSENEVTGFGDMTRAASWNAVTVATLLTGASLNRQYRFSFDGQIDGPSAGALTTVGVLSLILGDRLKTDVTMTGTINPTGTIGTVGGIPEKIQGVIDTGKFVRVLIPAGQRNTPNEAGDLVDVVDLGKKNGLDVVEVATIYDAYPAMTGKQLPTPNGEQDPKVDENGYAKLKAATDQALARFDRAAAEFSGLDASVQESAGSTLTDTQASAARARDLQVQGLQAGAFVEAQNAAAAMEALFNTFDTVQGILVSGFGVLDTKLAAGSTAVDELNAHIDSLGTYEPKTLTDVEALVTSYGNAFDALSLLDFGSTTLQGALDTANAGGYESVEAFLGDILLPLIYFEFGRGQLEFSKAVFEIGRDNAGGTIKPGANLDAIGSFLRRGADANWAAFESGVIATNAASAGVSNDVFRNRLADADLSVALSYSAQNGQAILDRYIGEGEPNAAYAAMGYGYLNYSRNALLLEKYYNNGLLDDNLNLVGVSSDTILSAALDLGRLQVSRALDVLSKKGTATVLTVGAYEQAGVDREGSVVDKFDAISQYSGAFLLARTMAFVGGYPRAGWSR